MLTHKWTLVQSSNIVEFYCGCFVGKNATFSRTEIHSDIYHLVGCDLRDTAQLSTKLDACGVERQLPTAFIAECVLVYMSAEQSSALVKWIAETFANVFFVNYEQVLCTFLEHFL